MNWLDIATLGFFTVNIGVGAAVGFGIYRVYDFIERSNFEIGKTLNKSGKTITDISAASKQLLSDLTSDDKKSSAKTLLALNRKVEEISAQISELGLNDPAIPDAPVDPTLNQKLREQLREVMSKNMALLDEIEKTKERLKNASAFTGQVADGFDAIKDTNPEMFQQMLERTTALENELQEAIKRANGAESLAEESQRELMAIREKLIEEQRIKKDDGASVVKSFKERISELEANLRKAEKKGQQLEGDLDRVVTEKNFIEDRYIQVITSAE